MKAESLFFVQRPTHFPMPPDSVAIDWARFLLHFLALSIALLLLPAARAEEPVSPSLPQTTATVTEDPSLLAVTPEMKTWLDSHNIARSPARSRLRLLAKALLERYKFQQPDEQGSRTVSASRAFSARSGNCVSFAFLFVALAREAGEPAYFVLSESSEREGTEGDLWVRNLHLAAGFGATGKMTVFDLGGPSAGTSHHFRKVSDRTAEAIFWSNRGTEFLLESHPAAALRWLDRALQLDASLPLAWTNRGVALRRLGNLGAAEAAYRQAIHLRPESVSAWRNLALLLSQRLQDDTREIGARR